MELSRRTFIAAGALSAASAALRAQSSAPMQDMEHMDHRHPKPERPTVPRLPAVLCKVTGTVGIDEAFRMLMRGADTLDAALHVCKTQEDDPTDHSTGLGGFPNRLGQVELDACCFHGPTNRSGAVACVGGIRNASSLANVLRTNGGGRLVGSKANALALKHGFVAENLLTDYTRRDYALWSRLHAADSPLAFLPDGPKLLERFRRPDFLPKSQDELLSLIRILEPLAIEAGFRPGMTWRAAFDAISPVAEPVYVACINGHGEMSCASTSSGQPWRQEGTASDVSAVGAGCFVDAAIGSAGSSGNAQENIRIAGAHTIVEHMRKGLPPEQAGMEALRLVAGAYKDHPGTLRSVDLTYYILRKDGAYAGVSLWGIGRTGGARQFTIMDREDMRRTEDCVPLFPGSPLG